VFQAQLDVQRVVAEPAAEQDQPPTFSTVDGAPMRTSSACVIEGVTALTIGGHTPG
jgi:hypothetical protein